MAPATPSRAPTCFCCCCHQSKNQDSIGTQIAEHIDTVTGLREALTWTNKPLRITWIFLVTTGVMATVWLLYQTTAEFFDETTATKVSMKSQDSYVYPPMAICPPGIWYDSEKARALGFSTNAVKYSFGYFAEILPALSITEQELAKSEFFMAYQNQNFSSLDAYFKAISHDLLAVSDISKALNSSESVLLCDRCVDASQKVFLDEGVCYRFDLKPQNSSSSRGFKSDPTILIGMQDRSEGTVRTFFHNHWQLFNVPSILATPKYTSKQPLLLSSPVTYYLTVSATHFQTLKDGEACFDDDKIPQDYSPELCYAMCMNPHCPRGPDGCVLFNDHPYTKDAPQMHPAAYCNMFDLLNGGNTWNYSDITESMMAICSKVTAQTPQSQECYKRCPPKCERTVYEIHMGSTISDAEMNKEMIDQYPTSPVWNMSRIFLIISHQGLAQGGILTMKQFSTITPAGFISNVGGALGLFLGATLMTLAQGIMFLIKYAVTK